MIQPAFSRSSQAFRKSARAFVRRPCWSRDWRTKALADFRKACELREKAGCIMLTYLNGQGKKTGNRDGGKAFDARP